MYLPIAGILLLVAVFYVVSTYNSFASKTTQIEASKHEIGNQLKRQAELIPNLAESAKGYLKHEKGIFKDLTDARKQVSDSLDNVDVDKLQERIARIVPKLQVAVESNPEIKGSGVVEKLMDELRDTSDKLMYARRTLIDLGQDYNQMLVVFPSSVIGSMFGFKAIEAMKMPKDSTHLEVSQEETKTPKIGL